jgi:hypothetical protein
MNEINWLTRYTADQLKALLLEQEATFWSCDLGIPREQLVVLEKAHSLPHAVIISGLRRVGKSTILAQMAHRLGHDQFYYLNFEDERFLGFAPQDMNTVYERLVELFGERRTFVLDEIQNVPGWEHFVRRFMDMGFKFYITGSNASLLSEELGTRLTGRYIPIELFPFSFSEFLRLRQFTLPDLGRLTTADLATLQAQLNSYLDLGGIPQALQYPDLGLHQLLYDDILYRDIVARYHVSEIRALKELAYLLFSNPAGLVSFNKLKESLKLGSVNTVKNFVEYLEAGWLLFTTNVYDYSIKRQQIAPKKVFGIDTGLVRSVGFSFSANRGKLWENLVFLALRRETDQIYYLRSPSGYEVDFYLPKRRQLIQVCLDLSIPQTREREVRALQEGMNHLQISSGLILTGANEEPFQEDGRFIEIRSLAQWLLTYPENQPRDNNLRR